MQHTQGPPDRDPELWEIAKNRASFKSHIAIYIAVNIFLWILWILTGKDDHDAGIPWPVWSTAGWGLGVIFHYLEAYDFPKRNSAEKEYEKLKKKQGK